MTKNSIIEAVPELFQQLGADYFTRRCPWESRLPLSFPDPLKFPTRGFLLGPLACFGRMHNVAYAYVVHHRFHYPYCTCDDGRCMPPHNGLVAGVVGSAEDELPGKGWVDVD